MVVLSDAGTARRRLAAGSAFFGQQQLKFMKTFGADAKFTRTDMPPANDAGVREKMVIFQLHTNASSVLNAVWRMGMRSFSTITASERCEPTITTISFALVTAVYKRFRVISGNGASNEGMTTILYSLP